MKESTSCCRVSVDEDLIHHATELLESENTSLEQRAKLFSLIGNEVRLKIVRLFLSYEK